jgi:hypothetical protein
MKVFVDVFGFLELLELAEETQIVGAILLEEIEIHRILKAPYRSP